MINDANDWQIRQLTEEEKKEKEKRKLEQYLDKYGLVLIRLNKNEMELAQEVAAIRSTRNKYHYYPGLHQSDAFRRHFSGIKGELAVSRFLGGVRVDTGFHQYGDGGIDMYWEPKTDAYPDHCFPIDVKTVTQPRNSGFFPEWTHPTILASAIYMYCRTPRHGSNEVFLNSWLFRDEVSENLVFSNGKTVIRDHYFENDPFFKKYQQTRVTRKMDTFMDHFKKKKE